MLFFSVLLCIIILLTVLLQFPLYIDIEYILDNVKQSTNLKIKFLGMSIKLKPKENKDVNDKNKNEDKKEDKKFSIYSIEENIKNFFSTYEAVKDHIVDLICFIRDKGISVRLLSIDYTFGFENAMSTGVMTGVFNAVAYNILSFLHHQLTINEWDINIQPDFYTKRHSMNLRCILKIKNVHIIIIAMKVIKIYFKISKAKVL